MLDSVKAEPKRVREPGLCHTKAIADRFHVNFAGARRLRAAKLAELETVPVRVVKLTDAESIEAQVVKVVELSVVGKVFLLLIHGRHVVHI